MGRVRRTTVIYKNISEHEHVAQYRGIPYVEIERPVHNLAILDAPNDAAANINVS